MNKRFFKDNITLYHIINGEATRIVFKGVYFRHNKKLNVIDKGLEYGSSGSITIPTTNIIDVSNKDYVVQGIVEDEFDLAILSKKYQVFKVLSVDDNRKGGLPHWKIGVSE